MKPARRVLVLAGGLTFERDVSLRSGRRVADALRSTGLETELRDADSRLLTDLPVLAPDAAFIALHGGAGEDGAIRAVLDLAGVPYVGSSPDACHTAFDKPSAKAVLRGAGVATPDWVALPQETFRELGAHAVLDLVLERLGVPLMVKPTRGGSALGASVVHTPAELPAAMVHCFSYGDTALVEEFVAGAEVAVSVLDGPSGPYALPAVEIAPKEGLFDYTARYTAGATDYFVPARLEPEVLERASAAAVTAHQVLGLRDLSRTDLIVAPDGTPWFLEVNVSPGMTETSMLPMSVAAAGLELGAVLRDLLDSRAI